MMLRYISTVPRPNSKDCAQRFFTVNLCRQITGVGFLAAYSDTLRARSHSRLGRVKDARQTWRIFASLDLRLWKVAHSNSVFSRFNAKSVDQFESWRSGWANTPGLIDFGILGFKTRTKEQRMLMVAGGDNLSKYLSC